MKFLWFLVIGVILFFVFLSFKNSGGGGSKPPIVEWQGYLIEIDEEAGKVRKAPDFAVWTIKQDDGSENRITVDLMVSRYFKEDDYIVKFKNRMHMAAWRDGKRRMTGTLLMKEPLDITPPRRR